MGSIFTYAIKSAICLTVLYLPYMLMLRNEKQFRFNRFVLIGIMFLSLIIPLMDFHFPVFGGEETRIAITNGMGMIETSLPTVFVTADKPYVAEAEPQTNWTWILVALYVAGAAIFLIYKFTGLIKMMKFIKTGCLWTDKEEGITVYCHATKVDPFSWMNSIVISADDYENYRREIMEHEKAHITCKHSYDILFVSFLQVVQWFNPFAWLIASSLRDVHEYEADDAVLRNGANAQQYQLLLIKKAVGSGSYAFANSFNHSLLKKRITMMLQKNSNPWTRVKSLYIVPVAFMALGAFATPVIENSSRFVSDAKVSDFIQTSQTTAQESSEMIIEYNIPLRGIALGRPQKPSKASAENRATRQTTTTADTHVQKQENTAQQTDSVTPNENKVHDIVEELPVYQGGNAELLKFLGQNIKYPKIAQEYGVSGRVLITFVINKDGSVSEVFVNNSHCKYSGPEIVVNAYEVLDENGNRKKDVITQAEYDDAVKAIETEAIRVVKETNGKWTPGKNKGKTVRVKFTLPILFRLP